MSLDAGRRARPEVSPADTVRADDRAHVFHSWSAQELIDPLPIARPGSYFWDHDGNRYLDLGSQLVNVNIGHQHPRLVAAIQEQAAKLCTVSPAFAVDVRSRGRPDDRRARAPGDLDVVFFTNGGAERRTRTRSAWRACTPGRHKVLATYRSYHGATAGLDRAHRRAAPVAERARPARRRALLGAVPLPVVVPRHDRGRGVRAALGHLREVLMLEGAHTVAAIVLETVVGTNGILVPPDGYLASGVRALRRVRHRDDRRRGDGRLRPRCGEWFAVDRWNVTPDLVTFAKGVNSGYVRSAV